MEDAEGCGKAADWQGWETESVLHDIFWHESGDAIIAQPITLEKNGLEGGDFTCLMTTAFEPGRTVWRFS